MGGPGAPVGHAGRKPNHCQNRIFEIIVPLKTNSIFVVYGVSRYQKSPGSCQKTQMVKNGAYTKVATFSYVDAVRTGARGALYQPPIDGPDLPDLH